MLQTPLNRGHILNWFQASDRSFLEKCHLYHQKNKFYGVPRAQSLEFGIRHYAGTVWYQVSPDSSEPSDATAEPFRLDSHPWRALSVRLVVVCALGRSKPELHG